MFCLWRRARAGRGGRRRLALQALARIALDHDLGELVLEGPGGCLGDAEPAPEFDAGNALLGLRDKIHGLKPHPQRQLAGGENGPGRDRGLLAAAIALKQSPPAARDDAITVTVAVRTCKAMRPAPLHQHRMAALFRPIELVKTGLTQAFLELDHVAGHRSPPGKSICS